MPGEDRCLQGMVPPIERRSREGGCGIVFARAGEMSERFTLPPRVQVFLRNEPARAGRLDEQRALLGVLAIYFRFLPPDFAKRSSTIHAIAPPASRARTARVRV